MAKIDDNMRRYQYIMCALMVALVSCSEGLECEESGTNGGVQFNVAQLTRSIVLKEAWVAGDTFAIFQADGDGTSKCYKYTAANAPLEPLDTDDQFIETEGATYIIYYPYESGWSLSDYKDAADVQCGTIDLLSSGEAAEANEAFTMSHIFAAIKFTVEASIGFDEGFSSLSTKVSFDSEQKSLSPTVITADKKFEYETFIKPGTYHSPIIQIEAVNASDDSSHSKALKISPTDGVFEAGELYSHSTGNDTFPNIYFWQGDLSVGSGTSSAPHLIYVAEDMDAVGDGSYISLANFLLNGSSATAMNWELNDQYKMMCDVDLSSICSQSSAVSWVPIGGSSSNSYFTGLFDGNGHTITNLYIKNTTYDYVGLFGFIRTSSTSNTPGAVQNLTVEGSVTGSKTYVGGVVGRVTLSSSNSTYSSINNVTFRGSVNGGTNTGGIVGYIYDGVEITNCTNEATVTSSGSNIGGIVGFSHPYYNADTYITACHNKGDIKCTNSSASGAGGILGANDDDDEINIKECSNSGVVVSSGTNTGGIVGYLKSNGSIEHCYNKGTVVGNSRVGGLVGYTTEDISCSYNVGDVYGKSNVGGFGGSMSSGGSTGNIENCYSACGVRSTGSSNVGYFMGFGISSVSSSYTIEADYCYYATNISSDATYNSTTYSNTPTQFSGSNDDFTSSDCGEITDDMTALLTNLNNGVNTNYQWQADTKNINNGYPILYWQTAE